MWSNNAEVQYSGHINMVGYGMTKDVSLAQSQWFYDIAGYYSYILLNATADQLKGVRNMLSDKGLQVLQAGKSYRPASNGVQYQWYIRVSDEKNTHPTEQRIRNILTPLALPALPTVSRLTSASVTAQPPMPELVDLRAAKQEREHQAALKSAELMRQQNAELQSSYQKTQAQLEEYRYKFQQLELQQRQHSNSQPTAPDIVQLEQQHRVAQDLLTAELQSKQKELEAWMATFEPESAEKDQKIQDLEEQIYGLQSNMQAIQKENKQILKQNEDLQAKKEDEVNRKKREYVSQETLAILLPQIEFLQGSLDILWYELRHPTKLLKDLVDIENWKAQRLRGAKSWLEIHLQHEWRLYYRKCENSVYQVYIAHKKTQEKDIDWLACQAE